jgi:hypothetical protein
MNIPVALGTPSGFLERIAFELGQDHAKFGLRRDSSAPSGFLVGYDAWAGKSKKATVYVRKWLYLRLSALKRNRVIDDDVTPDFLRMIVPERCPVSLELLTVGGGGGRTSWSVDRIVNDGAYARANLLVVSQRVNEAKGELSFEEMLEIARKDDCCRGLAAVEWARLVSLVYGGWCRAYGHQEPYVIPLVASLPEHVFFTTTQIIQLYLLRFVVVKELHRARHVWRQVTIRSLGSAIIYEELIECIAKAAQGKGHLYDVWLDVNVFGKFIIWYELCYKELLPVVDSWLENRLPPEEFSRRVVSKWSLSSKGYLSKA